MLDGKRYYAVFPDESPEMQDRMRSLFDLLKKLQKQLRTEIAHADGGQQRPDCWIKFEETRLPRAM